MTRLHPSVVATMNALLIVRAIDGRATVRDVAECAGMSTAAVHSHLVTLRRLGLVTWDRARAGTLRPVVQIVHASTIWRTR